MKLETEFKDLKDILLDSLKRQNELIVCKLPASRYRLIISQYLTLNMINIDGLIEKYMNYYDFYTLSELHKLRKDKYEDRNVYKFILDRTIEEKVGRCNICNSKRVLLNGNCYVCISLQDGTYTKQINITK